MMAVQDLTREQIQQIDDFLGITPNDLDCIMINTEPLMVRDIISEEDLYYSEDTVNHKYVSGIVSESVPHITLLFGLIGLGDKLHEAVDMALDGWSLDTVGIQNVTAFESTTPDEPYYCLVAELNLTPALVNGNDRLRRLPHTDNFPTYRAHITLAYIKHDESIRDELLYALNNKFTGAQVKTMGINYGD